MDKKLKIEFAPGAFDTFEGTQDELNELIAEITRLVESGEIHENSKPLDIDELIEEDPEMAERILQSVNDENQRKLQ